MAKQELDTQERRLLDSLLEGCQIIDKNWRYVYLNDAAIVHAQMPREKLIGKLMWDVYPGIEKSAMFEKLVRVMKDRKGERILNQFTYPDGSKGWFRLNAQPVAEGILILSEDITERELARQQSKLQLKRLDVLRHIDLAITSSSDLSVVCNIILDQITSGLEVDAATILFLDQDSLELRVEALRGFNDTALQKVVNRVGDGTSGRVALEQKPIILENIADESAFSRQSMAAREGFVSYFAAPLVSKGVVLGILELFHRIKKEVDLGWMDFFEIVAGQAAIALSHLQALTSVQHANLELKLAYDRTIEGWARTLEIRDIETEGHSQRVAELTEEMGVALGYSRQGLIHIRRGAILHDIGKMGIPDKVLLKPDKLNDEEWVLMKQHPVIAYEMLSKVDFLIPALDIPRYHHEKWDGSGYPRGLDGDLIPRPARIFALVDVWDALRSDRPYRPAWSDKKAAKYIKENAGSHFDPDITKIFVKKIL